MCVRRAGMGSTAATIRNADAVRHAGTCAWHATAPHPTIAPLYMAVIDLISDALKHLIEDVDTFLDLRRRDHQGRIEAHTGKVAHHQQAAL